ncbi:MAG: hypothetical protein E7665_03250 [Ruminococcaceae bacterium]|nr:hypothetical protein [Oscillospiraceae bacterium]
MRNICSLDMLCASLCDAIGVEAPKCAAGADERFMKMIGEAFGEKGVDRIFMYNPDAVAQWIYEKYASYFDGIKNMGVTEIPYACVMPSVTPVCFATMYTGAQPEIHGIRTYVKPVLTIDTIFDAMIRAGKKPVIVSTANDSISKIFLEREMDYFIYPTIDEVNDKASELIESDIYDLIVVYNGNYDSIMHKFGPESPEALDALDANTKAYMNFCSLIEKHWKDHNTVVGFAMDHGCHEIDGGCGSHGLDMDEDINIVHLYKMYAGR